MSRILLIFLLLITALNAKKEKTPDYLSMGALLVKDGYYSRALEVLKKVDILKEKFDFKRFYTLKGIAYQNLGQNDLSNLFLEEAVNKGELNPSIYLTKAKNYWTLKDYQGVIDSIQKAGAKAKEKEFFFVILAESYKNLDDYTNAWKSLDEGISLYPKYSKFYKQKFYYLLELGFYQQSYIYAKKYLDNQKHSVKDYLAVALSFRKNKQYEQAASLLEEARLIHPNDEKIVELLGQIYIEDEKYIAAALVFDKASITMPKFALNAAKLYLKGKLPIRSLQLNRRVGDQKDKFEQRLGIDIFLSDFESLVTKEGALKRYELLSDDNIRYALGYAFYRIGEYENAKKTLKAIRENSLFKKASYLFEKIDVCEKNIFECE